MKELGHQEIMESSNATNTSKARSYLSPLELDVTEAAFTNSNTHCNYVTAI